MPISSRKDPGKYTWYKINEGEEPQGCLTFSLIFGGGLLFVYLFHLISRLP